MKKNMGSTDKGLRIVAAIAIALLYYFDVISGTLGIVLMVVAIAFLITSFISFCPLYPILGINTCKRKE